MEKIVIFKLILNFILITFLLFKVIAKQIVENCNHKLIYSSQIFESLFAIYYLLFIINLLLLYEVALDYQIYLFFFAVQLDYLIYVNLYLTFIRNLQIKYAQHNLSLPKIIISIIILIDKSTF